MAMLAKKGLRALAKAMADLGAGHGLSEVETVAAAEEVVEWLQRAGAVTPHYQAGTFRAAVVKAYQDRDWR